MQTYVHVLALACLSLGLCLMEPLPRQGQRTGAERCRSPGGSCSSTEHLCHQPTGSQARLGPAHLHSLQAAGSSILHRGARRHAEILQALNQKGSFSARWGLGNLRRVQSNKIKTLPTKWPPYSLPLRYFCFTLQDIKMMWLNKSYYLLQPPFTTAIVSTRLLKKMGKLLDHHVWS